MKIKTMYFDIEIEWLLVITILISIFSPTINKILETYYICYLFILFHELSHVFVAAIIGKKILKFKLSLAGVCAEFKRDDYTKDKSKIKCLMNILVYLAGPISNFILAFLFKNNVMIFQINLFLGIINLIPVRPLDGFNILSNILSIKQSNNFKKKSLNKEKLLEYIEYFLMFALLVISILQIIYLKNPSILLFIVSLYILNSTQKNELDINRILQNVTS